MPNSSKIQKRDKDDVRARCLMCGNENIEWRIVIDFSRVDTIENSGLFYHHDPTERTNYTAFANFCALHKPDLDKISLCVGDSKPVNKIEKIFHI